MDPFHRTLFEGAWVLDFIGQNLVFFIHTLTQVKRLAELALLDTADLIEVVALMIYILLSLLDHFLASHGLELKFICTLYLKYAL
jgi:hypothetical protein